jgi:ubiquinone/menaquinone biosynthesis C-methylase UbiE
MRKRRTGEGAHRPVSGRQRTVGTGWDRMAHWRDERSGDTGDLWHRALIDPALLDVVGTVRRLRILDLACGNGYLARRFANEGASMVVGVDASIPTIRTAQARERASPEGVRFEAGDAAHLRFADRTFDLVVANMALMDIRDGERAIAEVARVLDPRGRFIFSISHPCFDLDDRSLWVVERGIQPDGAYRDQVWRKIRGYRDERVGKVPWKVAENRTVFTDTYHRTLSTYSRYLRKAGLVISRIEEPAPRPELLRGSPQGPYIAEIPLHLVVEAVPRTDVRPASRTSVGSRAGGGRRSGLRGRTPGTGSARRGSRTGS